MAESETGNSSGAAANGLFSDAINVILTEIVGQIRQEILVCLESGEMSVSEIADTLQLSRSLVSFHLRGMHKIGLVVRRAEGTFRHYSLSGAVVIRRGEQHDSMVFRLTDDPHDVVWIRVGRGALRPTCST